MVRFLGRLLELFLEVLLGDHAVAIGVQGFEGIGLDGLLPAAQPQLLPRRSGSGLRGRGLWDLGPG